MIVLQAMAILIEWPLLALVPLAAFLTLFVWSHSRIALMAALLWALYLPYELAMKRSPKRGNPHRRTGGGSSFGHSRRPRRIFGLTPKPRG